MDQKKRRHAILLMMLVAGSIFTTACNTIEGAGEDIESAGDAIDDEAEEDS